MVSDTFRTTQPHPVQLNQNPFLFIGYQIPKEIKEPTNTKILLKD